MARSAPGGDLRWPAVPGPVNRAGFWAAQERHRRAAAWLALTALLLVLGAAVVLGLFVVVLLVAQLHLALRLLDLLLPLPALVFAPIEGWLALVGRVIDPLLEGPGTVAAGDVGWLVASIVAPGAVPVAFVFRRLRRAAARELTAVALRARPADPADPEERQLINVVEELAIAAGVSAPEVLLWDAPPANVGVFVPPAGPAVVVARALLDRFDRAETQALLATAVADLSHGNPAVAELQLAALRTAGTVLSFLDAPFGGAARRRVGGALRGEPAPELLHMTFELAELGAFMNAFVPDEAARTSAPRRILGGAVVLFLLPLVLANILAKVVALLAVLLVAGPLLSWQWRRRRFAADATAVQLTRDPSGLAQALAHLFSVGGVPASVRSRPHCLAVGVNAQDERALAAFEETLRSARGALAERLQAAWRAQRAFAAATRREAADQAEAALVVGGFHPPMAARVKRLARLGAEQRSDPPADGTVGPTAP